MVRELQSALTLGRYFGMLSDGGLFSKSAVQRTERFPWD